MSARQPFSWVEVDCDGCSLTFGTGACTAALGVDGVTRKCFNTFNTCRKTADYNLTPVYRTMRYCQPRSNMPKGATIYPFLVGEPSEYSATVNIAGSDGDLSAFGRRATISARFMDAPDHDRYFDKYQSERVSGAAQSDGIGYPPYERGTHFAKLKTRWPFYAGRAMRRHDGYIVDGAIVDVTVRHYVITNMSGPGDDGMVTVEGSDVLDLADDKRTRAPKASNGKLLADVSAAGLDSFGLSPAGVGALEYPASGRARIGSEFVDYTRTGDTITLTARAVSQTLASTHRSGDTFQRVLRYVNARVDDVVSELLQEAGIYVSYLPLADWAAEVNRWMAGTTLTRDIGEPTGVKALISQIVPLGFSLFWDSATQKIRFKANRPVDGDQIWDLSDLRTNLDIDIEEDDKKRVSEVLFWTVQKTPAGSATATDNYARTWVASDPSAREEWRYRTGAVKSYTCPWLNRGADSIVRVAARRLLKRFDTTPIYATITLDAKWKAIQLTDVVRLRTRGLQDDTGREIEGLFQVTQRSEPRAGERIKIVVQSYQFSGRFAYATPNASPKYLPATAAQRDPGMFACDPITLKMPNGDPPYEAI